MIKDLLTVVIPSKNESELIGTTLTSLNNQWDISGTKVILCDCSDDNTQEIALSGKYSKLDITIIGGGLPSVARNNGAKLSSTPYVLFIDADTFVLNTFLLLDCLNLITNKNYDLVTCKFKTDKTWNWIYRIFDIIQWFTSFTKPFALGGFMLFKRETFNKLGGFNEEDKVAEDYRLSSRVKPNKFKIVNDYVYTSSRRFYKKGIWYIIKLMWKCWINRNNDEFFKDNQNYWK
jgi:glycosyltransferase involved in cell wall biosynthesis